MTATKVIPVILCGGSGTRLWPYSADQQPKQFLKIFENESLLQTTVRRLSTIEGQMFSDVFIVTVQDYEEEARHHLVSFRNHHFHFITEPCARGTASAVARAAMKAKDLYGEEAALWVLPSDHYIESGPDFSRSFNASVAGAQEGHIVTLGIKPVRAECGYGYIEKSCPLKSGLYKAASFIEKPDAAIAQNLIATERFLWSSGMHMFTVRTGLRNFRQYAPCVLNGTHEDKVAFETAILEKTPDLAVAECNFNWSDIGSWRNLWDVQAKDDRGNVCHGDVFCDHTQNSLIMTKDKSVSCLGMDNVIVIVTDNDILIANKDNLESLKAMVQKISEHKASSTLMRELAVKLNDQQDKKACA